jgi:hypothetical protein
VLASAQQATQDVLDRDRMRLEEIPGSNSSAFDG